jgi:hypothetical protein
MEGFQEDRTILKLTIHTLYVDALNSKNEALQMLRSSGN